MKKINCKWISDLLSFMGYGWWRKVSCFNSNFFHGADGAIIVYDCTKKETFERAGKWFDELHEYSESNPKIILVGNKIDLPDKVISSDEGKELAQKYEANCFEISALTGMGIQNIFENIATEIYNYKSTSKKEHFEIDSEASSNIIYPKVKTN